MNGYQRPGFPTASACDSHILRVVSDHRPFAAQILAAEERRNSDLVQNQQRRLLRDARAQEDRVSGWTWLRLTMGTSMVRLGARLQGMPASVATETAG
jgi:hypothetical protein